jgi:hypothetical protein
LEKNNKLWVRCTAEEYNKIKIGAEDEGLSMGNLLLARYFGYEIEPEKVTEYNLTVKKPSGKVYNYTQKRVGKPALKGRR